MSQPEHKIIQNLVFDGNYLACPICGGENTHISGASTQTHDEAWRETDEVKSAWISFEGECGHKWMLSADFSKGQTELSIYIPGGQK